MVRQDFHVHSHFSDGVSTPEEIVERAITDGMERLGFSDHVYAPYDLECCIPKADMVRYRDTIRALQKKYAGKIEIFCGIEQDIYSEESTADYDYVIGSVHYIKLGDAYYGVDYKVETLREAADKYFDGDLYGVVETYFDTVAQVYDKTGCDVIGHFDLISKLNERYQLFDENHPRYVAAWKKAADKLLKTGKLFEINTGAISRGYRTQPYPARPIMEYLANHGAKFILSSDSHDCATLRYQFDVWEQAVRDRHIPLTELKNEVIR